LCLVLLIRDDEMCSERGQDSFMLDS
jgi:hypothetical protein